MIVSGRKGDKKIVIDKLPFGFLFLAIAPGF